MSDVPSVRSDGIGQALHDRHDRDKFAPVMYMVMMGDSPAEAQSLQLR